MKSFPRKALGIFLIFLLILPLSCRKPLKQAKSLFRRKEISAISSNLEVKFKTLEKTLERPKFDEKEALRHVSYLSSTIGTRREGTTKEKEAAEYIRKCFEEMGYSPLIQKFSLPNGATSQNIIAVKRGISRRKVIIGAHYDTVAGSSGANDNASGVGVILALAHALKNYRMVETVEFIAFGAEERIDRFKEHHHYGSRFYVKNLSRDKKSKILLMISVDMVGAGDSFKVRAMIRTPFVDELLRAAAQLGYEAQYLKDSGLSDHEAFSNASIPSLWLEVKEDPNYHSSKDTLDKVDSKNLRKTGEILLEYLTKL